MIKNLPTKYVEFIEECKMKNYETNHIHKHHILPRFMGGSDDVSNLVELSVSDHFEAHKLLAENVDKKFKVGAWSSLNLLKKYWDGDYEEIRSKISKAVSGENNGMFGKTQSDEYKQRLRIHMKGEGNPFYEKNHSNYTKNKMSKNHADVSGGNNPASRKCIDLETNTIYSCIKEMAESIGVPRTTMNRWIKDDRKTKFKYIENE